MSHHRRKGQGVGQEANQKAIMNRQILILLSYLKDQNKNLGRRKYLKTKRKKKAAKP